MAILKRALDDWPLVTLFFINTEPKLKFIPNFEGTEVYSPPFFVSCCFYSSISSFYNILYEWQFKWPNSVRDPLFSLSGDIIFWSDEFGIISKYYATCSSFFGFPLLSKFFNKFMCYPVTGGGAWTILNETESDKGSSDKLS